MFETELNIGKKLHYCLLLYNTETVEFALLLIKHDLKNKNNCF